MFSVVILILYYKNFGTETMAIYVVRVVVEDGCLKFKEEVISAS